MRTLLFTLVFFFGLYGFALAGEGMITLKSAYDVPTTADRLVNILKTKGMKVFNRIDHAAGAKSIGKELRPTELVIFGNPKVGTPLMLCSQGAGIDLPQKALIWEDASGQVFFAYNDPKYMAKRHGLKGCDEVIVKVGKALGNFAKMAVGP